MIHFENTKKIIESKGDTIRLDDSNIEFTREEFYQNPDELIKNIGKFENVFGEINFKL